MSAYAKIAVVLLAFVLGFAAGREWRDRSADVDTAQRDAGDAQAQTQVVTQARENDTTSQAGAAVVEQQRTERAAESEAQFKIIYRDVVRYVQTNPSLAGCGADPEFVRLWNAANAGTADAKPVDPAGAAVAVPGADGR
jgi:hypothetical protein